MTNLLETAIAKLRNLPKGLQDKAAKRLLEVVDEDAFSDRISIEEAREAYANGDFLTLSTWKRDLGISDN